MSLGLLHLHSQNIIHRDIKSLNVMVTDNYQRIMLGDMSESKEIDVNGYISNGKIIGTPFTLSPEVILKQGYDQRSDIWALGVTLY